MKDEHVAVHESRRRSRRIHILSFVLAFVVFCLAYLTGLFALFLGSLAMHGPQPWHYLDLAKVTGTLAGGLIGLTACLRTRTLPRPWIPWVFAGLLCSVLVDEETLRDSLLPFYVVAPGVMLAVTVGCMLWERRTART